jgi:hypothetical protein
MGGGNDESIYAVVPFSWNEDHPFDTPVKWHTGDIETDPWEWRMRVLDERDDIAYAKMFFKKSGYITKAWYPYFLAVRRRGMSFEDALINGHISYFAKRIYDIVSAHKSIPLHLIKEQAGIDKEDKSKFESALVELQMKLFITIAGRQQKVSLSGAEYGWSSTVFCTTEQFWEPSVFEKASEIGPEEAYDAIRNQILLLNPNANEKKIAKFIKG